MQKDDTSFFKSHLAPGVSGDWRLEPLTVIADDTYDPDEDQRPDCAKLRPGSYIQLIKGDTVYMSDLYDEWWTQKLAIDKALQSGGHILIMGLGIGLVVEAMLKPKNSTVESITVVEYSQDVIELVAPQLLSQYGQQLKVIQADALTWQPLETSRYSVIWHDIWPSPYGEDVDAEMDLLEGRYEKFGEWQGFWPKEYRRAYQ